MSGAIDPGPVRAGPVSRRVIIIRIVPSKTPNSSAPDATSPYPDARLAALRDWLGRLAPTHGLEPATIRPASADASFRRYFRVDLAASVDDSRPASRIVMDAPPAREDCRPFVHAARILRAADVRVPDIHAQDLEQGFLLLEDFGDATWLDLLHACAGDDARIDALMRAALDALVRMQAASRSGVFPDYDRALLARELDLYPQWYVERHRGVTLTDEDRNTLEAAFSALLANNLAQARVFVHRDWHSRNLMMPPSGAHPGVIDFQDAVYGPLTYDLVSMLRDAYIEWPEERQIDWAVRHWQAARAHRLPVPADFGEYYRDIEWMGLQRHLKVLGIFARLYHRDGKERYLADLPRVSAYVLRTVHRYREFAALARLIERIEPAQETTMRVIGHTF